MASIRTLTAAGAVASALLLAACSEPAPLASVAVAPRPAAKAGLAAPQKLVHARVPSGRGWVRRALSSDGALAQAPAGGHAVTATIGPQGGLLLIDDTGGKPRDDLYVAFQVPAGALEAPATITMTVTGQLLSELVVDFEPAGLRFSPRANLYLRVGTDRVDLPLDGLDVVHLDDDGSVQVVDHLVVRRGRSRIVHLWAEVPGFSRYGLRRGT